jgi:hypothetical protein
MYILEFEGNVYHTDLQPSWMLCSTEWYLPALHDNPRTARTCTPWQKPEIWHHLPNCSSVVESEHDPHASV